MFLKIISLSKLLFSKEKSNATEGERGENRARKILQTSVMSMFARFINIFSGLITVPLTLPYLGVEQFGIWMVLTGFVAFLSFTDLGLSIGLQTALTRCDGQNDKAKPSYYVSNAFILILAITSLLCFISIFVLPYIDLSSLVKLNDSNNASVLMNTCQLFLLTFAFGLPSGLFQRIFDAYQLGLYSNILLVIGRSLSLISIFVCIELEYGLPVLVMFYMGLPFLVMTIGGNILIYKKKWLRPHFSKLNKVYISQIISVGTLALRAQVGASIMSSGPLLLLTAKFGAAAIVPFAITQRLFGVVSTLLSVVLAPLWPAYGEAKARGDYKWIQSTFRKSIIWSIWVVIPFFLFFLLFGQKIISLWTDDINTVPSFGLLLVCNIWMFLFAGIRVFSMYLNGLSQFKGQARYGLYLPILAMCIGWLFSSSLSMVIYLAVLIIIGELGRLIGMIIESSNVKNY